MSFAEADAALLRRAIDGVTKCGDAIVLSLTSDQGAVSVRILHDKQVNKAYAASLDELQMLLSRIAEATAQ